MADVPCVDEAASDLSIKTRVPKERHKLSDIGDRDVMNIGVNRRGTESVDINTWASGEESKSDDHVNIAGATSSISSRDRGQVSLLPRSSTTTTLFFQRPVIEQQQVSIISSTTIGTTTTTTTTTTGTTKLANNKKTQKIATNDERTTIGDFAAREPFVVIRQQQSSMNKRTVKSVDDKKDTAVKRALVGVNSTSFKGQIRTAEDSPVGPCGKKRCADRYDSSESSDSGVAVSCGECSSSGTSDITEPGSPCSTSSDEGVAGIRAAARSPPRKLAPTTPPLRGPQWPWTPPLAATACSTYKKIKGEPEAGTLPKAGAADPTPRGKTHHDGAAGPTQGKITEYFKTQIKPQQAKTKKTSTTTPTTTTTEMSLMVTEFRRPATVQRSKGGLAKYLGSHPTNGRPNDWEVRTLTMSPPPMKKLAVVAPRASSKMEKQPKQPSLAISTHVLNTLPAVKLSSLRLPSDVSPDANSAPAAAPAATSPDDLDDNVLLKPSVNENNNLTTTIVSTRGSQKDTHPRLISRQVPETDEGEKIEEEETRKQVSSPILSAPTTIRFPAQAPGKSRPQTTDSGICRWDQCDARFESSSGLLEHLQAAHINTQTGGDNFVCQWQGCKVQGRTSCSRRWLERHVLSHGGNKPFRCIVDGCGSRFSSQITLERHVNGHFNQPETSSSSSRRSCENGGKLVRRNGKRLRYRRQPWSARLFDYFDTGVMEGLHHRLLELAKTRTQGRLAETPGRAMALTSQVLARRIEPDGTVKVLLRWYPHDIAPDEWVLESEVSKTKNIGIRNAASTSPDQVDMALYTARNIGTPPKTRIKQRRKPVKNS